VSELLLDKVVGQREPRPRWPLIVIMGCALVVGAIVVLDKGDTKPWSIDSKKDPITDQVEIEAMLGGEWDNDQGAIWMNCTTASPEISGYVALESIPGSYVRAGPEPVVKINYAVRFDDERAISGSIMGPEGQQIIKMDTPFVNRLARSKKLAYRIGDRTVVFDTTGAAAAIRQLRETCRSDT
jgi:hypothetical protein